MLSFCFLFAFLNKALSIEPARSDSTQAKGIGTEEQQRSEVSPYSLALSQRPI